jgi:hypothetical protein
LTVARLGWVPDAAVVAAILVYSTAVWWPTRDLPYHWDAAMFTIPATRDLLATHFRPFVVGHSDFAHPPVFMALLALAWMAFGASRAVSHAFVFPFLPLAMMGTFALGTRLPTERDRTAGHVVGATAAFLFGGVAVVLEEVGQIYAELPAAAAIVWGLFAFHTGRVWCSALLFAVAAAFRIPSLIVPATLGIVVLATPDWRHDRRRYVALLVPFALFAAWLFYHRVTTGWTVSLPQRASYVSYAPRTLARNFRAVLEALLLDGWRFVILAAALCSVLYARISRRTWGVPRSASALLACVVGGCAFFAVWGEFGLRYGVFLLPAYFVATLAIVRSATRGPLWVAAVGALAFPLFVATWHPTLPATTTYDFMPPQDLGYLDMIAIGRSAAAYVESTYPNAEIYGAVPESYELSDPDEGYVAAPLAFAPCTEFERHPERKQIIYKHGYSPGQIACAKVIDAVGARFKKRFESDGKWVDIFVVPRSSTPAPVQ